MQPIRVLIVDDFEKWRAFAVSTLRTHPGFQIVGEASDGFEALRKAQDLQPDLILLDVGIPGLNGIQAARRILEKTPKMKILFLSENRSRDIAEEALDSGAHGYVLKSDAVRELLPALEAVLHGDQFVSSSLAVAS